MAFDKKGYMKAYREKHKEELAEYNKRSCSERYYRNHEANKRKKREDYRDRHDDMRAKAKQRYAANREKLLEQSKASAARRKDKLAAYHKRYYELNREELRNANRRNYRENAEAYKRRAVAYGRDNPGHRAAIARKRHAVKQACPVGEQKAVMAFYRMVRTTTTIFCHWCKKEIPKGKRTVDHVVPIARGGAHSIDNLVPACRSCNCSKSSKLPEEYQRTAGNVVS